MRFPPRFLDEVRERVPLGELVGRRVKLARAGRELKGLCPFHNEKTPSFHVVEEKNFYHCFGCGAHGDVFTFLTEAEGLSFPEAVEEAARRAGMPLPRPDPEAQAKAEKQAGLHEVMESATRVFQEHLGRSGGKTAREYLERRGLSRRTIADFRLGYAPDSYNALKEALRARGIPEDQIREAGLVVKPEDGRAPYDRFRNRIIFPITDRKGRVIAFGGRALDDNPAKYLNSPDTPLFHKGRTLYNLAGARKPAYESGRLLVVEGYTDVLSLAQAGLGYAVAPLGTALTEEQLGELWRLSPEPVLCFDGDAAGWKAADRAIDRALGLLRPGQSLRFAMLPEGLDPDDLVRREGAAAMRTVVEAAEPLSDMLWRMMTEVADHSTPERRAGLERAIYDRLDRIGDQKVRNFYRQEFRDRLFKAFAPNWPRRQGRMGQGRPGHAGESGSALARTPLGRRQMGDETYIYERLVMLYAIHHPWLVDSHEEELADIPFRDPALDALRQDLLVALGSVEGLDSAALRAHLAKSGHDDTVTELQSAASLKPVMSAWPGAAPEDAETGWQHVLARLRRLSLQREIEALETEYRESGLETTWQRLIAAKREVDRCGGTEAEVESLLSRRS